MEAKVIQAPKLSILSYGLVLSDVFRVVGYSAFLARPVSGESPPPVVFVTAYPLSRPYHDPVDERWDDHAAFVAHDQLSLDILIAALGVELHLGHPHPNAMPCSRGCVSITNPAQAACESQLHADGRI